MASFTDSIPQFNDYVATSPVDAMRSIGILKEQQYQQGVQKVQNHVDSLLSLPLAKKETQDYVKDKIGALRSSLQTSISGDLSNQRLVNQVGGLISTIANDPIVQNGVKSTAAIQSGMAAIEQSKKDGKWSQQNQDYFNEGVSNWMGDRDVNTVFEDSYTPWVDYQKKFNEVYKDLNKDQMIQGSDMRWALNKQTGKMEYVNNPTIFTGISPDKIKAAWNLVASDPAVQKQLEIDGWSNYRNLDNQQLVNSLASTTNNSLQNIQASIRTLQTQLSLSPNSPQSADIASQIQQLQQTALETKRNADSIMLSVQADPNSTKTAIQNQRVLGGLIDTFSFETMKKSPLWETSMEQARFDREARQWQATFDETKRMNDWKMVKEQADIANERVKAAKEGKLAAEEDVSVQNAPLTLSQAKGSATALQDVETSRIDYTQAQRALVNSVVGTGKSPYVLRNGVYEYNVGRGPGQFASNEEAGDAAYTIYLKTKDQAINGTIEDPDVLGKYQATQNAYDILQSNIKRNQRVQTEFAPQIKEIETTLGKVAEKATVNGREFNVDTRDLVDVYMIKSGLPGANQATARLNMKYGNAEEFISQNVDAKRPLITGINPASANIAPNPLQAAYNRYSRELGKNKGLTDMVQGMEDRYAQLQNIEQSKVVTYPTDEKSNDVNIRRFASIATTVASLNESSDKGVANDMLEALRNTDKASKDNIFQSEFNYATGRGQIVLRRGNEAPIILSVPSETYFNEFSNQRVNRTFAQNYGAKLAVGEGNTNWDGGGRATAYNVQLPSDSPYTVQYHLKKKDGDNMDMFWWVTRKGSDTPLIDGVRMNGNVPAFPINASEADIVEWAEKLKDKNWLNTYMQWFSTPK